MSTTKTTWTERALTVVGAITSPERRDELTAKLQARVCGHCRKRRVAVVVTRATGGERHLRRATSCTPCQREAFRGL